jgi:hypothetical protein
MTVVQKPIIPILSELEFPEHTTLNGCTEVFGSLLSWPYGRRSGLFCAYHYDPSGVGNSFFTSEIIAFNIRLDKP